MSLSDVLTLIVALYGAAVATILGLREIKKEKRVVKVTLEYVDFYERVQARIVNVGHRPITITGAGMSLHDKEGKKFKFKETIPAPFLIQASGKIIHAGSDEIFGTLPVTLEDGQQILFALNPVANEYVIDPNKLANLWVTDAEGNSYGVQEVRELNPKWGTFTVLPRNKRGWLRKIMNK